ncbi:LysR substrate-binding domain-containing protein [Nocardioides bruguierae]|uniref:LysR substrate-binding domain-containing protein n=1 Tax=Nocardioides bruguierae TaxID=2945102 RepID=A0A9X2D799_9ACTN|nr:LysR substrate-binding domain-containing protein [Nocardioides bruguierae]MCM0620640.1 LysR substrate-binding domain-containing protein [Nocardioides bruguierae]
MELRHLRSFVALAEEQHFGRAAARLHLAQPALSQQLQQLEREVGVRLVDRSTRRVALTDAGRLLEERARAVLGDLERTTADLAQVAAGRLGRCSVGFVGTATYDVLPRLARRAREDLPGVTLDLRGEQLAPALLDAVRERSLDLAVLRPGAEPTHDLVVTLLRAEPLVAVLPTAHPAAAAGVVDLADLADEVLVTHPSGHRSAMHGRVLEACARAGFTPREVLEVGETATLAVFVAGGLGVALVPASVQALRLDGVAYVPLARAEDVDLVLAHHADAGPAAHAVARLVRDVAGG